MITFEIDLLLGIVCLIVLCALINYLNKIAFQKLPSILVFVLNFLILVPVFFFSWIYLVNGIAYLFELNREHIGGYGAVLLLVVAAVLGSFIGAVITTYHYSIEKE